jgi:dTDP-4-amino-4,6-dideoxygalactose transaminase
VQAAILRIKLRQYDQYIATRRRLASIYDQRLRDLAELLLPPAPDADPRHFDIFQNYEIEADRRDQLRAFLESRGVKTIIQWGGHTIHQFPALGLRSQAHYTERMTGRFMLLPMNTALAEDEVHYICDAIREFYGHGR